LEVVNKAGYALVGSLEEVSDAEFRQKKKASWTSLAAPSSRKLV